MAIQTVPWNVYNSGILSPPTNRCSAGRSIFTSQTCYFVHFRAQYRYTTIILGYSNHFLWCQAGCGISTVPFALGESYWGQFNLCSSGSHLNLDLYIKLIFRLHIFTTRTKRSLFIFINFRCAGESSEVKCHLAVYLTIEMNNQFDNTWDIRGFFANPQTDLRYLWELLLQRASGILRCQICKWWEYASTMTYTILKVLDIIHVLS